MSDDPWWDGVDRRHFIVTAIGASAALAANTDPTNAQATIASRGTVYSGDTIDGKTKFELVINLKTAKALGLDVPLHLQQLADEMIE